MPGTGKTVCVLEVIKKINLKFDFVHINAMQLTNPNAIYTIMYEKITETKTSPANAALYLDDFFKRKDKTRVLMQNK